MISYERLDEIRGFIERLDEIRGFLDWKHSGWQTIPSSPKVTVYDLAAAVEDPIMERDSRA